MILFVPLFSLLKMYLNTGKVSAFFQSFKIDFTQRNSLHKNGQNYLKYLFRFGVAEREESPGVGPSHN